MIEVSNAWKEAHKQTLLPESFVEILMEVSNNNVSASVYSSQTASFSDPNTIINADKKIQREQYALLEHNRWTLDGEWGIAPDEESIGTNTRFVGTGASESEVTVSLSKVSSEGIPGVTITWSSEYNEYATAFTVTAINAIGRVLGTVDVTNNKSVTSSVDMPIANYKSLRITITDWSLPDHRHRIDSVKFGQVLVFDKNQIINYSHEMSGDPFGAELSRNAITFEVDNTDGRWNWLNPSGMGKYLYERQRLTVYYGLQLDGGIEWIQAGVFYLSEWKAPANGLVATFVARDAIEFMLNATYERAYLEGTGDAGEPLFSTKDKVYNISTWDDGQYVFSVGDPDVGRLSGSTPIRVYEISAIEIGHPDDVYLHYALRIDQGWIASSWFDSYRDNTSLHVDLLAAVNSCLPSSVPQCFDTVLENSLRPYAVSKTTVADFVQQCGASFGITLWQTSDGMLHFHEPDFFNSGYVIPQEFAYSYPEVELSKPLKEIQLVIHYDCDDRSESVIHSVGSTGDSILVDTPYLLGRDPDVHLSEVIPQESVLIEKYTDWWKRREMVSGEFRADPRLELFDVVSVETKYGTLDSVVLTNIKYTYNGSFHCAYSGKAIEIEEV